MFAKLKHQLIKNIEKIPLLQIFIYNNLQFFKFLFPHDKDYYALRLLFSQNEKRAFLDIGGNIGLSSIGFRELGFKNNIIHLFEPDKHLIRLYLDKIKDKDDNLIIHPYGLSNKKNSKKSKKNYAFLCSAKKKVDFMLFYAFLCSAYFQGTWPLPIKFS